MGRHLSPRYGQVILVRGYPVLTAVNWWQQITTVMCNMCAISVFLCSQTSARLNTCCPMVRTDGWAGYGHVITKFSGVGRFTYPWCSAGALLAPELRYNFYSYVHKHRECRLKQQYNGCKSPKGQEKTGPSWTYASYSKNGEKAIQCRLRLAKQVYKCISLFHCHHCMTTMWNYFMFYELHKASIFFFYLCELSYCP